MQGLLKLLSLIALLSLSVLTLPTLFLLLTLLTKPSYVATSLECHGNMALWLFVQILPKLGQYLIIDICIIFQNDI